MKILETDRLRLRPWELTDAADMYEYAKTDLVGPDAGWPPHKSVEESREIIQKFIEGGDVYAIVLKEENKVIGGIGIHNRKPDTSQEDKAQREIGYVLNPKYWGQGLIPEAVECVLDYCFDELALELVWCAHYDFNAKSKRVIEKTGFTYRFEEMKTLDLLDGREVLTLYYSMTRAEYQALGKA